MGWCIECHRQMPVNANNPYYQHYEEVHKALAKKLNVSKLTVAEMGGLECAKCHY
jgi:membrane protein containing cytochrome c domain protein